MLDIKEIRRNPEEIKTRVETKNVKVDLNAILELDDKRRSLAKDTDDMKSRRNTVSQAIAMKKTQQRRCVGGDRGYAEIVSGDQGERY